MDWKNQLIKKPERFVMIAPFLVDCCCELNTTPGEVQTELLSASDIEMICTGKYSRELVTTYIQSWIKTGKPKLN